MGPFIPLLVLAVALVPLGAAGLPIDDFEDGDVSVSDTTVDSPSVVSVVEVQTGLLGALGEVREITVNLFSGPLATVEVGSGTLTASVPAGGSATFSFQYDGAADGFVSNQLPDVDLALGGDRFAIDVGAVTGSVSLFVHVSDAAHDFLAGQPTALVVSMPGTYEVPFSAITGAYSPDFTEIDAIHVRGALLSGESISIESLSVVPEPGAAPLLALGLMSLGLTLRTPR